MHEDSGSLGALGPAIANTVRAALEWVWKVPETFSIATYDHTHRGPIDVPRGGGLIDLKPSEEVRCD